jgi:hypothetical protein
LYPYTYSISLRLKHPTLDPKRITGALHRKPTRAWMAGDARQTPTGEPLPGTYAESYWYLKLRKDGPIRSKDTPIELYLRRTGKRLSRHKRFFRRVRSGGGGVELFIGIYASKNHGFELPPDLLALFGALGLSLSFDLYGYPQNWGSP